MTNTFKKKEEDLEENNAGMPPTPQLFNNRSSAFYKLFMGWHACLGLPSHSPTLKNEVLEELVDAILHNASLCNTHFQRYK